MKRLFFALAAMIFMIVGAKAADTAPSYPGGDAAMKAFIEKNLNYPPEAKANGIEGVVNVGFIVKTDGTIGTIKIIRMVDPDLEQESIRIVKLMPAWNPATKDGVAVEAPAQVSIPFTLTPPAE